MPVIGSSRLQERKVEPVSGHFCGEEGAGKVLQERMELAVGSEEPLGALPRGVTPPVSWRPRKSESSLEPFVSQDSGMGERLQTTGSLEEALAAITQFSEPGMIRGVPVGTLLAGAGQLFSSSNGHKDEFGLSRATPVIGDFISHNWSLSRWQKFMTLAFHYNMAMAVSSLYCAALFTAALTGAGYLPSFRVGRAFSLPGTCCYWSLCISWLAFALTLFFGNAMRCRCMCGQQRLVFLDKACIPQRDKLLKLKAIRGLAAFLNCSEQMIVVYTDTYLRKLWTVYEVASFLTLHGAGGIVICGVSKELRVFAASLLLVLETMLSHSLGALVPESGYPEDAEELPAYGLFLASIGCHFLFAVALYCCTLRFWFREVHGMHLAIQDFSFQKAKCAVEEDRKFVMANIALFMKALRKVPEEAHTSEALQAFDEMVRERLPDVMSASCGRLEYTAVVISSAGFLTFRMDEAGNRAAAGMGWPLVLHVVIEGLVLNFGISPVSAWLMMRCFRRRVELRGWREVWLCAKMLLLIVFPFSAMMYAPLYASKVLAEYFGRELAALAFNAAYLCLLVPLGLLLHWRRPGKTSKSTPGEAQPEGEDVFSL